MTFSPLSLFLIGALTFGAAGAGAEKADRNKPMNVEADALRYDELKQVSAFTGHVVLTKGSILIRGARVEVRQDADGNQFGLIGAAPGKLAFFRQKRDGLDEFIEGEAESIEYDGRADTIKFTNKARLRRFRGANLGDELSGAVILYNNRTDVFSIDGRVGAGATGERVRAMLTPQPDAAKPAAANPARAASVPASGVLPALRYSPTLGGGSQQ